MIWFSSDFHFNHRNICGPALSKWESGYRNFDDLETMNRTIIRNVNQVVKPNDTLYFLGDFAFGDRAQIPVLRQSIKCQNIILLVGNHDDYLLKHYSEQFEGIHHYLEIKYNKKLFVLCHYPLGSWRDMERGSYQLHGHCHSNYPQVGRQIDVGVDSWEFRPINIDFIRENFSGLNKKVDHHGTIRR